MDRIILEKGNIKKWARTSAAAAGKPLEKKKGVVLAKNAFFSCLFSPFITTDPFSAYIPNRS